MALLFNQKKVSCGRMRQPQATNAVLNTLSEHVGSCYPKFLPSMAWLWMFLAAIFCQSKLLWLICIRVPRGYRSIPHTLLFLTEKEIHLLSESPHTLSRVTASCQCGLQWPPHFEHVFHSDIIVPSLLCHLTQKLFPYVKYKSCSKVVSSVELWANPRQYCSVWDIMICCLVIHNNRKSYYRGNSSIRYSCTTSLYVWWHPQLSSGCLQILSTKREGEREGRREGERERGGWVISGFCHTVDENCALLGYYTSCGNSMFFAPCIAI